jgi:mycofactocin system glycosyltransferase
VAVLVVIRYALDDSARRVDDGTVLIGGSPLSIFRLSDTGARVLERLIVGQPAPRGAEQLTERLLDAGAIHPRPERGPFTVEDVTVVIPTRDTDVGYVMAALGPVGAVIVVDDASDTPIRAPEATVIRRAVNRGPAAARNTGLAAVSTPLVAFVDADCRPQPGWLEPLLAHFADDHVAAVAPRITSPARPSASILARYEAARSPLDLGPTEARVRARTRVSYVPSAALLARTDVLLASGGFDEDLRHGEDVDLVWRLDECGLRVRYEPASEVWHQPRRTLGAWLRQRMGYGRSAAGLARRHPGAVAPVAVSGWSAAVWTLVGLGHPVTGVAVGAATAGALARKLQALHHPVQESLQLAGLGHLFAGRLLASAVTRVWWPLVVPLAIVSRRVRRLLVAAAVVPAMVDWVRTRPAIDPLRYLALRLLDDGAYGVGVWRGAVEVRTIEPLLPDLTSWPRPSRYDRARPHAS